MMLLTVTIVAVDSCVDVGPGAVVDDIVVDNIVVVHDTAVAPVADGR